MARLSLTLFGPFQVTLDGEPVTGFDSDKVRALLAYLAVEADRPHRRESLAGLLWPDWPERSARKNLSGALYNLRQVLGDRDATPPFLLVDREAIQFNLYSDHTLDVADFVALVKEVSAEMDAAQADALEEAVSLYRGPFLEGYSLPDSAPFEEWALLRGEELRRLALHAQGQLAAYWEQVGELDRALEAVRRQVVLEPGEEEGHRHLMRLLALSGRRGAALAQYEACRRALAEELEVEPSVETTSLYEQIRDGELGARKGPQRGITPATGPAQWETPPAALPTGTVTFLFTDIQGSTPLWEQKPRAMKVAVARHHAILRQAIGAKGGVVFKIVGDEFQAAFDVATDALSAALTAQYALYAEEWGEAGPLRVRMGLHTGPAEVEGEDYAVSHTLNRTARVMTAAGGGQILLSQEAADLVRRELQDRGEHRLKGLALLEHLYQVVAPDLPQELAPSTSITCRRH